MPYEVAKIDVWDQINVLSCMCLLNKGTGHFLAPYDIVKIYMPLLYVTFAYISYVLTVIPFLPHVFYIIMNLHSNLEILFMFSIWI